VIVHVATAPEERVVGWQATDDTEGSGATVTVAVAAAVSVAVKVTVWDVATEPAVAVNVVEFAAAGTVTDGGTGSAVVVSDDKVTAAPAAGAGCVKVIVHVVAAPGVRFAGVHASVDTLGLGATATVVVTLPPSDAVTTAVWAAATDPAVAVNVAELVVAATTTDAGTGNAVVLSDESATVLPPAGAGWVRLTVHVVADPDVRFAGTHASDETPGAGATVTVNVASPPSVALTIAV
jgi:hypothetical protein